MLTRSSGTRDHKFYVESIPAGQDMWIGKVNGESLQFPERCAVCLEPATHRERWNFDSSYIRHVCTKHKDNPHNRRAF